MIWLFSSNSFTLLILYAVLLGGGYGGFIVLSPAVAAELFGLTGLGTILGTTYTAAGIGGLLDPTLVGYLIDQSGSYYSAIIAAMIFAFFGFLLLFPVERYLKKRDQ